jgi:hypothetical protein
MMNQFRSNGANMPDIARFVASVAETKTGVKCRNISGQYISVQWMKNVKKQEMNNGKAKS